MAKALSPDLQPLNLLVISVFQAIVMTHYTLLIPVKKKPVFQMMMKIALGVTMTMVQ